MIENTTVMSFNLLPSILTIALQTPDTITKVFYQFELTSCPGSAPSPCPCPCGRSLTAGGPGRARSRGACARAGPARAPPRSAAARRCARAGRRAPRDASPPFSKESILFKSYFAIFGISAEDIRGFGRCVMLLLRLRVALPLLLNASRRKCTLLQEPFDAPLQPHAIVGAHGHMHVMQSFSREPWTSICLVGH